MQKDWLQHHQYCLIENLIQLQTTYFKSAEINLVFAESTNLKSAIKKLQKDVEKAVKSGSSIIHLIEDLPEEGFLPINALLAVGAVHQHLVKLGLRSDANIIVTTSSAETLIK